MTAWISPRDGAGTWEHSAPHDTPRSLLTAFVACLAGLVLMAGLVTAGRALMCKAHDNNVAYCPGYVPEATP